MRVMARRLVTDESGQGLVEYALIIALVSIGLILALSTFKNQISNLFDRVNTTLNTAS
jgi:pilus assembly protein Flp/PilA